MCATAWHVSRWKEAMGVLCHGDVGLASRSYVVLVSKMSISCFARYIPPTPRTPQNCSLRTPARLSKFERPRRKHWRRRRGDQHKKRKHAAIARRQTNQQPQQPTNKPFCSYTTSKSIATSRESDRQRKGK